MLDIVPLVFPWLVVSALLFVVFLDSKKIDYYRNTLEAIRDKGGASPGDKKHLMAEEALKNGG